MTNSDKSQKITYGQWSDRQIYIFFGQRSPASQPTSCIQCNLVNLNHPQGIIVLIACMHCSSWGWSAQSSPRDQECQPWRISAIWLALFGNVAMQMTILPISPVMQQSAYAVERASLTVAGLFVLDTADMWKCDTVTYMIMCKSSVVVPASTHRVHGSWMHGCMCCTSEIYKLLLI